jgi:hypothetical protein
VARERAWARADGRVFHAAARRLWSCAQSRCAGMAARPLPPGRLGVPLGAGRAGRRVFHVKRSVARAGPGWRLAVSSASKLRGASGSRVAPGRVLRVDALWRERVQGGAVGHVVRVSCSVARTGPGWRLAVSSVDALWRERVQGGAWPCRPGQLLRGANGSRVAPGRVLRVDALWRERVQGGVVGHVVRVNYSVARTGPGWRLAVSSTFNCSVRSAARRRGGGSTRAGSVRTGRGERRPVEPYAPRGPSLGERPKPGVSRETVPRVRGGRCGRAVHAVDPWCSGQSGRPAPVPRRAGRCRAGRSGTAAASEIPRPFAARGSVWANSEAGCFT